MELISTLCFGAHLPPEPAVIKILINTVFTKQQELEVGTRDFSPYHETKSDEVPVIRSFLLQLLLEHKYVVNQLHYHQLFFLCHCWAALFKALILLQSTEPTHICKLAWCNCCSKLHMKSEFVISFRLKSEHRFSELSLSYVLHVAIKLDSCMRTLSRFCTHKLLPSE